MAVTLLAWVMVTVQLPVPLQAPLHPAKLELPVGAAVSVTDVPVLTFAEQVLPQSMIPIGTVELTVPVPPPALATVSG